MENDFISQILNSGMVGKFIAFVIAIQLVLFALGEALTRISEFTENKWDNDAAKKISSFAWYLGVVISKFGYSVPKLVLEEKAKQIIEKQKK